MGGTQRRIVMIDPTTLEPDTVFLKMNYLTIYFNSYTSIFRRHIDKNSNKLLFGWLFRWADDYEIENNVLLPPNDRMELK